MCSRRLQCDEISRHTTETHNPCWLLGVSAKRLTTQNKPGFHLDEALLSHLLPFKGQAGYSSGVLPPPSSKDGTAIECRPLSLFTGKLFMFMHFKMFAHKTKILNKCKISCVMILSLLWAKYLHSIESWVTCIVPLLTHTHWCVWMCKWIGE